MVSLLWAASAVLLKTHHSIVGGCVLPFVVCLCFAFVVCGKGKGKGILFNVGGQTGKDCLLTWADVCLVVLVCVVPSVVVLQRE